MAATEPTLRALLLIAASPLIAAGCAEPSEPGLVVEDVDATFGLARANGEQLDAGGGSSVSSVISEDGGAAAAPQDSGVASVLDAAQVDAGPPPRTCRNVSGFTEKVTPALVERCVRCHDGTKSKATKPLDLTSARDLSVSAQQRACDQLLKSAPDTSEKSPIFAEVNPGDTMTVHDFKYPSSMAYMTYRSAVLAWLESED